MESISKYKELSNNITSIGNYKLLKATAIFGKNASGKSNLLLAFAALKFLVRKSGSFKLNQKIVCYEPFLFESKSSTSPIIFEIQFFGKDKLKYHYKISYNNESILEEELYFYPKNQRVKLFVRKEKTVFEFGKKIKNKVENIQKNLFPNQLFLSKIGTEKVDELICPFLFFEMFLFVDIPNQSCNICDKRIIDLHKEELFSGKDKNFWKNITKFLKIADTGIKGINIKENKETDFAFPESMSAERKKKILEENRLEVLTKHNLYKNNKIIGETTLKLEEESSGTNRLLAIGGLILEALSDGTTFVLDELDRSLHPYLTRIIVEIFNDPRTNPNNAQLIFATHDISILNGEIFRRDQIWFAEKDEMGQSSYYSLGDLKGVRKDVPFEKYYMKGLFGGIPKVTFYDFDFNIKLYE
ncbi:MAG: ATP-binding protein [Bacteroidales bacterium]